MLSPFAATRLRAGALARKRPRRRALSGGAVLSIVSLLVSIFAIYFSWRVSVDIHESSEASAEQQFCTDALISFRSELLSLKRGYENDPSDKLSRLADWDEAVLRMDEVVVMCHEPLSATESRGDMASFEYSRSAAQQEYHDAYLGEWSAGNTNQFIYWTGQALKEIRGVDPCIDVADADIQAC